MLIGKLGHDFAIAPSFQSIVIESDLEERDFLHLLSELVDVQKLVLEEATDNLDGGEQPKRLNIFLKEE